MNLACTSSLVIERPMQKKALHGKVPSKYVLQRAKDLPKKDIQEIVKDFNKKEGADLEMSAVTTITVYLKRQRTMN